MLAACRDMAALEGIFAAPEGAATLAALQQLIDSPARRRELAARANERALEFNTLRMASGYLALYSELIDQRRNICGS